MKTASLQPMEEDPPIPFHAGYMPWWKQVFCTDQHRKLSQMKLERIQSKHTLESITASSGEVSERQSEKSTTFLKRSSNPPP